MRRGRRISCARTVSAQPSCASSVVLTKDRYDDAVLACSPRRMSHAANIIKVISLCSDARIVSPYSPGPYTGVGRSPLVSSRNASHDRRADAATRCVDAACASVTSSWISCSSVATSTVCIAVAQRGFRPRRPFTGGARGSTAAIAPPPAAC